MNDQRQETDNERTNEAPGSTGQESASGATPPTAGEAGDVDAGEPSRADASDTEAGSSPAGTETDAQPDGGRDEEDEGAPESGSEPDRPTAETTGSGTAPSGAANRRRRRRELVHKLTELPVLVFLALVIAVVIKSFLVQAFFIPSGSMIPTLRVGDRVLVEKVGYRFGSAHRGQVVVFEKAVFGGGAPESKPWYRDAQDFLRELLGLPTGENEDYIKRVVGVGGDVLRYAGSPRKLEVNGDVVDEPYIRGGVDKGSPSLTSGDCDRLEMEAAGKGCRVPAGTVFVMGDNRGNSEDSRIIGPIDVEKIVGRAFAVIWPPGDFGGL